MVYCIYVFNCKSWAGNAFQINLTIKFFIVRFKVDYDLYILYDKPSCIAIYYNVCNWVP